MDLLLLRPFEKAPTQTLESLRKGTRMFRRPRPAILRSWFTTANPSCKFMCLVRECWKLRPLFQGKLWIKSPVSTETFSMSHGQRSDSKGVQSNLLSSPRVSHCEKSFCDTLCGTTAMQLPAMLGVLSVACTSELQGKRMLVKAWFIRMLQPRISSKTRGGSRL